MKTASYLTYDGPGRVAISRSWPRKTPKGFRGFRALTPGKWFHSVDVDEYSKRYAAEVLAPLDPRATWDELHRLAAGAEPVLLCFEHPEDGLGVPLTDDERAQGFTSPAEAGALFCHRAIVAAWFEATLGERVPEVGYETSARHPLSPDRIVLPTARAARRAAVG